MKKNKFWLLILLGLSQNLTAQTAAEKLEYLQKNLRIWVLHQPNVDTPNFYSVKPAGIFLDTDDIIMGKKTNNGMDNSAKLLSALFKSPDKRSNGGDGKLQNTIYTIMNGSISKPIDCYFINDAASPVTEQYINKYSFYFKVVDNKYNIFSGTYIPKGDTSAGRIVIGDYSSIDDAKTSFISLVSFISTGKYTNINTKSIFSLPNKNSTANMYKREQLNFVFPANDMRNSLHNAIGLATIMQSGINGAIEKNYYDNWLAQGPFLMANTNLNYTTLRNLDTQIPDKYRLNTLIKNNYLKGLNDTGYYLTNPPFNDPPAVLQAWKIYSYNLMTDYMRIRNEFVLGLLCKKYIDKQSLQVFISALHKGANELLTTPYENQLSTLIENLFIAGMGNSPTINENTPKSAFYPMALMDLFLDFPMEASSTANLSKFDETFYGVFPEKNLANKLLTEYFKLRPQIYEVVEKNNKKPGISRLSSGYENFTAMTDAIWKHLKSL